MTISIGCHGSTWDLDYDQESDRLDAILDAIALNGFEGIDAQIALLGRYRNEPKMLKEALDTRGLRLAALTVPFTWPEAVETPEEKNLADYYIDYLHHFPGALLNIPARTGPNRRNLRARQEAILACANAIGRRSLEKNVQSCFHPSSPPTSYFRTREDYQVMFELIDQDVLGWTPDLGHIERGRMDSVKLVKDYFGFVKHIHIKDHSALPEPAWCKMGTGDIDFVRLGKFLHTSGYDGWIMMEEETKQSAANPDEAIRDIGAFVTSTLRPATVSSR